jgi:hypothetical protein
MSDSGNNGINAGVPWLITKRRVFKLFMLYVKLDSKVFFLLLNENNLLLLIKMNTEIEIRQKLAKNITALQRQIEEVEQVKVNLERDLIQLRVQLDKKCEELKFQLTCQNQKKSRQGRRKIKILERSVRNDEL